jgi:hypothetical protein
VRNRDAERLRVDNGEHIDVTVTVRNRITRETPVAITASLGELLLEDGLVLQLPARVLGDRPPSETVTSEAIEIRTDAPTDPSIKRVQLEPGRHMIRVDVADASGLVVANAAKAIWVETDPEEGGPELPFRVEARDPSVPSSIWELIAPYGAEPDWVLEYTRTHPTFRAALMADGIRSDGQLVGRRLFFGEMICSALVEWALTLFREQGDESGFQVLVERAREASGPVWEAYLLQLEELQDCRDEVEVVRITRRLVSLMLYAVQQDLIAA